MPSQNHSLEIIIAPTPDSPLILATKSGCTEIVKKILQMYPQAVEHIDKDGRDILHVAIQYRRMEIYKVVINMKYPLMRLKGEIDNLGNSILHMVGQKVEDQKAEVDIRSPALILRDDLLLFEVNDRLYWIRQIFYDYFLSFSSFVQRLSYLVNFLSH